MSSPPERKSLDITPESIDTEKSLDVPQYKQDAFGDEEFAEVKYKVLKWWQCGLLMVAETVSLGVLSLPAAVAGLGLVPAILVLLFLGCLATYTGYVIGQMKLKYPHISTMADAGEVIGGKWGRELVGGAWIIFFIFIMSSHLLTFTVAMNTITNHGTCSVVFGIVGMLVSFVLSLPRTLVKMSWLSLVSFGSIMASVIIVMIAVGITKPGSGVVAVVDTDLYHGFSAVCNIVFAFCGHAAFFGLMAELKNPKDFTKSLCLLQGIDMGLYITASLVIYRYAGSDVTSPALGSASPVVAKVAYGIALPTIIIAGVINGHVAFKMVYLRIFQGTDRMHKRDWIAWGSWVGIALGMWILAWIIATAIPVFSNLLTLITALFASWFTYGLSGVFWLFMNKGLWFSSPRKIALTALNVTIVAIAAVLCGLGLWVSGKALHADSSTASFSCSNNA
ncbi:Amino acid transporter [Penicillium brevicompactum]|uniref:Amino acid transporter transmembrane n=1 Tax=Penicillium brevicompactum TaxID=5074 RepID=A0A9W9UB17_PENBR|nr:Amino acid transporter transmembrane [Penicillium brevicompactum]KAJ5328864.1 Amino acid transporter transmembrane [Penicillium brevicompactum]KAJ5348039.1 Amino acid transporter transmembrane [Penicillium brevicompactum]